MQKSRKQLSSKRTYPLVILEVRLRRVYIEEGGLLVQYELPVGPAVCARIHVLEQRLWRARLHLDPTND